MFPFYFNFRMNEETKAKLDILSKNLQRTKSNLMRWLIHKEYIQQGFEHLVHTEYSSSPEDDTNTEG